MFDIDAKYSFSRKTELQSLQKVAVDGFTNPPINQSENCVFIHSSTYIGYNEYCGQ